MFSQVKYKKLQNLLADEEVQQAGQHKAGTAGFKRERSVSLSSHYSDNAISPSDVRHGENTKVVVLYGKIVNCFKTFQCFNKSSFKTFQCFNKSSWCMFPMVDTFLFCTMHFFYKLISHESA